MAFGVTAAAVGAAGAIGGAYISSKGASKAAGAAADAASQNAQLQWGLYQQQRQDQFPYTYTGSNALNELAMRLGIGGYNPGSLAQGNLVDSSTGVPEPNLTLYNTNQAYRDAWDALAAQHYQGYGKAYTADSDSAWISNQLKQALAPQIAQAQQDDAARATSAQGNPLYGSLLRSFSAEDFQTDPGYQFRIEQGQKQLEGSAAARGGLLSGAAAKALTKYNQDFASNEYSNAYNRFNNDQDQIFNRLAGIAGVGQKATAQVGQAAQNYGSTAGQAINYGGAARASGYTGQANALAGGLGSAAGFGYLGLNGLGGGGGYSGYSGQGSLFGGPGSNASGYGLSPISGINSGVNYPMGTNWGFGG